MIDEKEIKKLLNAWGKTLTDDINRAEEYAKCNCDNLALWSMYKADVNSARTSRDIVRHIRAKIFELEDW